MKKCLKKLTVEGCGAVAHLRREALCKSGWRASASAGYAETDRDDVRTFESLG